MAVSLGYQKLQDRVQERTQALKDVCAAVFAGKGDVTLEIGCGHGHFLNAYADVHPEEFCVGIDIIGERIYKSKRKQERAERENIAFVKSEAVEFLEALPEGVRIKNIFILFPDPWPKRRHFHRRLMQASFLTLLCKAAAPDARLYFRTDHKEYFRWALSKVSNHPDWQLVADVPWPFEHETFFQNLAEGYQSLVADCSSRVDNIKKNYPV